MMKVSTIPSSLSRPLPGQPNPSPDTSASSVAGASLGETGPGQATTYEIVLTGGACSGKTTSLGAIAHMLRLRHIPVLTVPESFTLLINGGISAPGEIGEIVRADGTDNCAFQEELFFNIRKMRKRAQMMAARMNTQPVVILYDRAELDALAFHNHNCFDALAATENTTIPDIRSSYDAVMHLVTTADGAEEFYSDVTNVARWESPAEARASDARLFEVWKGARFHRSFDNSTDFDGKLARLLSAILECTGLDASPPSSSQSATQLPLALQGGTL